MKSLTVVFVLLLVMVVYAESNREWLRIEQCLCDGCSHIDTIWRETAIDSLAVSEIYIDSPFWEEIADAVWSTPEATLDIDTCDSPILDTIRWERQCKWVPITRVKNTGMTIILD